MRSPTVITKFNIFILKIKTISLIYKIIQLILTVPIRYKRKDKIK